MTADDFKPRLGRIRDDGRAKAIRHSTRVVGEVARNTTRQLRRRGHIDPNAHRRGLAQGAISASGQFTPGSRRVIVRARYSRLTGGNVGPAQAHLRYVLRDGTTPDGAPGRLYDAVGDDADAHAFLDRSEQDPHQFRFIVSAEDSAQLSDLKPLIRDLMRQVEQDLGTKLDWVAVDHFNTGRPHTHVILRGKDEEGRDLIIAREYIAHGMRQRAVEIATLGLGPRTDLEIEAKLRQEVSQDRLTSLDRGLLREAESDGLASTASGQDRFRHALRIGRLSHLRDLGLAQQVSDAAWRLEPGTEAVLRRMGERDDIIRTMQRALTEAKLEQAPAGYSIVRPDDLEKPLIGRLVARGLHDANDRHYMIVDGVDGRSHWVDIGRGDATEFLKRGAVISIVRRPVEPLHQQGRSRRSCPHALEAACRSP